MAAGSTTSSDFPVTPEAYDTSYNRNGDLFVAEFDAAGANLFWSTFVGGSSTDEPSALVLADDGDPSLSGSAASSDFTTTPAAFDRSYGGNNDAFLTRLDQSGSVVLSSSYLGGGQSEGGWERAGDPFGNPVLTGPTRSIDFPTTSGAYDRFHDGESDVFLVAFDIKSLGGVDDAVHALPLLWAEPNPFSGGMQVRLDLSLSGEVNLRALDMNGRQVAVVHRGFMAAGRHWIRWDGRDARGRPLPAGIYWLSVWANKAGEPRKIVCIR